MLRPRAVVLYALHLSVVCGTGCGPRVVIFDGDDTDEIRQSIRVGVERAGIHPDERISAWTGITIQKAPCDIALEIVWLEFSAEAFGVIWAYRGEDSNFQPVRMYLPPGYPKPRDESYEYWPQRELRTVDVLLRPSKLALNHADLSDAWQGAILIEDVPMTWKNSPPLSARRQSENAILPSTPSLDDSTSPNSGARK